MKNNVSRYNAANNNAFTDFLTNYWYIIVIVLAIVVTVLTILLIIKYKNRKKHLKVDSSEWVHALGEKDNIKSVSANGSRLSIEVIDKDLINRDELTKLGVSNIIFMSNKITMVIENRANEIADSINSNLNK